METDRRVNRAKAAVPAPLHDLYEEKVLETRRIELEILAGLIAVVKNIVGFDGLQLLRRQIDARFEVVIVVLRNRERFDAVCFKLTGSGDDVSGRKRNMLHAGAEIFA